MIPVTLLLTRIPLADGTIENIVMPEPLESFIDASKVDTVTTVTESFRQKEKLPGNVRACVRYFDPKHAFRLFYVTQEAQDVARMRFRCLAGEDPASPDYAQP